MLAPSGAILRATIRVTCARSPCCRRYSAGVTGVVAEQARGEVEDKVRQRGEAVHVAPLNALLNEEERAWAVDAIRNDLLPVVIPGEVHAQRRTVARADVVRDSVPWRVPVDDRERVAKE